MHLFRPHSTWSGVGQEKQGQELFPKYCPSWLDNICFQEKILFTPMLRFLLLDSAYALPFSLTVVVPRKSEGSNWHPTVQCGNALTLHLTQRWTFLWNQGQHSSLSHASLCCPYPFKRSRVENSTLGHIYFAGLQQQPATSLGSLYTVVSLHMQLFEVLYNLFARSPFLGHHW